MGVLAFTGTFNHACLDSLSCFCSIFINALVLDNPFVRVLDNPFVRWFLSCKPLGHRILSVLRRLILSPFLWGMYFLSGFVRRDRNLWVFGNCHSNFSDNSKYLYLYVNKHVPGVRAVWISSNKELVRVLRQKGFEAYYKWSIGGMVVATRAGVWFFTCSSEDINCWLSNGALLVNLWHGIPLKKIEYDAKKGISLLFVLLRKHTLTRVLHHILYPMVYESVRYPKYYVLATSPDLSKFFSSAFRVPPSRVIVSEYPRCKVFFEDLPGQIIGVDRGIYDLVSSAKNSGTRVIVYAPTFRDDGSDERVLRMVDWHDLDELLERENAVLLIKPHVFSSLQKIPGDLHRIHLVNPRSDLYPILKHADALITDYSSIYFDFLLLDRPIVFFCYDLEDYLSRNRDMYFDYDSATPGPKVRTYEELKQAIIDVLRGRDEYAEARRKLRSRIFAPKKELVDSVQELL
ncbi:MAG: hypothetical protein PWP76_715 [Candidatus Diapherotrites archaeon]|nr:hypothetical protein [Candidatus Diapherotrites archaeon]